MLFDIKDLLEKGVIVSNLARPTYKKVNILQPGRLNYELALQFEPVALSLYRQRHIHHLAYLPLLAMGSHHHRPETRIGQPGLPQARRAICAVLRCGGARPSTITSEPRGISGRGGRGSEGVMGEETARE